MVGAGFDLIVNLILGVVTVCMSQGSDTVVVFDDNPEKRKFGGKCGELKNTRADALPR